jgi:hypothetical protein
LEDDEEFHIPCFYDEENQKLAVQNQEIFEEKGKKVS